MIKRKFLWSALVVLIGSLVYFRSSVIPVFSTAHPEDKVPILMYHKISPYSFHGGLGLRVPPELFELQMNYLKKHGYHTVSLDQVTDHWDKGKPLPSHPIVISMDDGYEDNYTFAFPILKKMGFSATIFLVNNDIGGYNEWDAGRMPHLKLLSWPQIRAMKQYGISFQSHTLTHPHLTKIKPVAAQREIYESKTQLEKALGVPVNFIAYPYGGRDVKIDKIIRQAGYKAGISTDQGQNNAGTDRCRLKRIRITGHVSMSYFKKLLR